MKRRGKKSRKVKAVPVKLAPLYLSRVLAVDVQPGEVAQVVVAHDSDCKQLRGGACTCAPDVTVVRGDARVADVSADGVVGPETRPS